MGQRRQPHIYLLIFLRCICGNLGFDLPMGGCRSDITINKDHYNVKEIYNVGEDYPGDAHYDSCGNLFYVKSDHSDGRYNYDINMIEPGKTTSKAVEGLPGGKSYSIAVDKKGKEVYFGTERGIYRYNYDTNSATLISDSNLKLNSIVIDRDGNKYITQFVNGVEELYLLDGKKKIPFNSLEELNELAIDDKNNFYFIKEEKIYVLKSNLTTPMLIGNVTYDGIAQITIFKDNVFIASDKLSYFHENDIAGNLRVVDIPVKVSAIAFADDGGIIIGIRGKLLKYCKNECYHRDDRVVDDY